MFLHDLSLPAMAEALEQLGRPLATADYSDEEMHAALDVNIPNYASAIVTTNEAVDSISSLKALGLNQPRIAAIE
jgi:hypothetical protein